MNSKEEMVKVIQDSIEGYEIQYRRIGCIAYFDVTASEPVFNFDEFEYRTKPTPVLSWGDLREISGWRIARNSAIVHIEKCSTASYKTSNLFTTKEQAIASLAMAKISQLVKQINGDWMPDWCGDATKYCIYAEGNKILVMETFSVRMPITFRTEKQAELFRYNHTGLLEKALLI